MKKLYISSELILYYLLCLITSSIFVSLGSLLILKGPSFLSFWGVLITILYSFFVYLILASPVQYILNKNPKKFNILFLLIYLVFAFIFSYVLMLLSGTENPLSTKNIYVVTCLSAVVYWIFDSIFLQNKKFLIS